MKLIHPDGRQAGDREDEVAFCSKILNLGFKIPKIVSRYAPPRASSNNFKLIQQTFNFKMRGARARGYEHLRSQLGVSLKVHRCDMVQGPRGGTRHL